MMEPPKAAITLMPSVRRLEPNPATHQPVNSTKADRRLATCIRHRAVGMIHSYWREGEKKDEAASGTPVIG